MESGVGVRIFHTVSSPSLTGFGQPGSREAACRIKRGLNEISTKHRPGEGRGKAEASSLAQTKGCELFERIQGKRQRGRV